MLLKSPGNTAPVISPKDTIPAFDYHLEALRGLAALTVVLSHVVLIRWGLDPHYQPTGVFAFQAPSHLSVLVFFILSGYVIGITNKAPLAPATISLYVKKRLVRIYPIYLVSILLALPVSWPLTGPTLLSNLLFGQVLLGPVIAGNTPLWSLHYEVLFYLLFIPVSYFRVPPLLVCVGCLVAGLGVLFFSNWSGAPLLKCYLFGFSFWSVGLVLARLPQGHRQYRSSQLVSAFLLFLSLEHTNQLQTVFTKTYHAFPAMRWSFPQTVAWVERAIMLVDFSYLPYCLLLMLLFTNRDFPLRKYLVGLLYALPAYVLVYLYRNAGRASELAEYAIPVCSYGLSLLMLAIAGAPLVERLATRFLRLGLQLGGISYGLYIIHYPILMMFRRLDFFSGTWLTFGGRFVVFMLLSIGLAYVLEKKMQPWVRGLFFARK